MSILGSLPYWLCLLKLCTLKECRETQKCGWWLKNVAARLSIITGPTVYCNPDKSEHVTVPNNTQMSAATQQRVIRNMAHTPYHGSFFYSILFVIFPFLFYLLFYSICFFILFYSICLVMYTENVEHVCPSWLHVAHTTTTYRRTANY